MTRSASDGRVRRAVRIAALILFGLLAAAAIGLYTFYRLAEQGPAPEAKAALRSHEGAYVDIGQRWLRFEPLTEPAEPTVILYPGASVASEAYAPLAHRLAAAGHRTYIVRMPFNLAVLAANRADEILAGGELGERFVIGGHSLGGAMAAWYAAEHAQSLDGVFLLGAYADKRGDLSRTSLPVLQIAADRDRIVDAKAWSNNKRHLPAKTQYVQIAGGNHAQFGAYGPQKGDGKPAISGVEQLRIVSDTLLGWMRTDL
ncbi:alpha/beta hydrolase [Cohnella nanjingensis]|uniref:Alpha/beta hydrolase n=1 Tax=Cohnella nanjingensis TaxID=1387779 RepID=A0A7X0RXM3_9BACL|nr:alpha/beta hydrolase [Cohnella nanjingensis]MBB6675552.1 alpha/beta hydrolase [Cohnella nanjingensis]